MSRHDSAQSLGEIMLRMFLSQLSRVFQRKPEQELSSVCSIPSSLDNSSAAQTNLSVFSLTGHELRTPLNAIVGYAELLQQSERNNTPAHERLAHTAIILENAHHLQSLVTQILDAGRAAAGELSCAMQDFDLAETLEAASRNAQVLAKVEAVSIKLHLLDGITLHADPHRINQILSALLDNAIRFSPKHHEVVVSIGRSTDNQLILSIANRGKTNSGMITSHLFNPFAQGSEGLSRAHNGLGLSLYLAKSIAKMHGGDVELSSLEDGGTTAQLCLPAHRVSWPPTTLSASVTADCNVAVLAAS